MQSVNICSLQRDEYLFVSLSDVKAYSVFIITRTHTPTGWTPKIDARINLKTQLKLSYI